MEISLCPDQPPRDYNQDPDVGGKTSEFEVLELPGIIKLPSVLMKSCCFKGHRSNVRVRVHL